MNSNRFRRPAELLLLVAAVCAFVLSLLAALDVIEVKRTLVASLTGFVLVGIVFRRRPGPTRSADEGHGSD